MTRHSNSDLPESQNLLEARDVTKIYPLGKTEVRALKNVSLDVREGEFSAIAGSSGSGKTTLLNLLGCLDVPTSGAILIRNQDVVGLTARERATFRSRHIGFIFQTFNLLPVLSALENVEYPLLIQGVGGYERTQRALTVLSQVGLERFAHHRPDQMSGGQRQRVAIARAMVKNPKLVLADEPTANLDKKTAQEILEVMAQFNRDRGVTFLFSTHDSEIIARAQRVIELSDGVRL